MNPQLTIQYETLKEPKNQTAKILKKLIETDGVNERQFTYNSFRIRLSELRKELLDQQIHLHYVEKDFVNEFKREGKYRHHFILECDKEKALQVYNSLNK